MQLCFCLYFCVHFLTKPLTRIDNDNVRNEPHTRTRRPAEFKRGMHQTNNDILWFGNERRVITYLLVLMHANTRNKFRNQCEQKYCCGMENRCIGKRKVDTRLNLVVKHDAAVAVRLVAILSGELQNMTKTNDQRAENSVCNNNTAASVFLLTFLAALPHV